MRGRCDCAGAEDSLSVQTAEGLRGGDCEGAEPSEQGFEALAIFIGYG